MYVILFIAADRAIRDQLLADAWLLYARALRLIRAAGYPCFASATSIHVNFILGIYGSCFLDEH